MAWTRRRHRRVPARAGAGRRERRAAVRLLGGRAVARATTTEHVAPASARALARARPDATTVPDATRRARPERRARNVPIVHFGVGTGELLAAMHGVGADVVGVDYRIPLDEASRRLGHVVPLQGNIDPALLAAPWPVLEAHVRDVLARGTERPRTSSTSATACRPTPTPTCSPASSSSSTRGDRRWTERRDGRRTSSGTSRRSAADPDRRDRRRHRRAGRRARLRTSGFAVTLLEAADRRRRLRAPRSRSTGSPSTPAPRASRPAAATWPSSSSELGLADDVRRSRTRPAPGSAFGTQTVPLAEGRAARHPELAARRPMSCARSDGAARGVPTSTG